MPTSNTKKQTGDILPHYLPKLASTPASRALVRHYYEHSKFQPNRKRPHSDTDTSVLEAIS